MTDPAIVQSDIAPRGRNAFTATLVPAATLCALVVAAGTLFILRNPSPEKPASPNGQVAVQTWVVERPHINLNGEVPQGVTPAQIAAAARELAANSTAPQAGRDNAIPPIPPSVAAKPDAPAAQTRAPEQHPATAQPAIVERVPVPPPRPAFLAERREREDVLPRERREEVPAPPRAREEPAPKPSRRRLARLTTPAPANAPEDNRNFIEKLFNVQPSTGRATAYAPSDGGIGSLFGRKPSADGQTAIYDIAAHTVYLPNGQRLEAHSGLGANLDNPASAHHANRGATPPAVYSLSLREELFHGVQALRLTPIGSANTYGRNGFLAHTFMLGPRGDSNGCVVFRNYDAFLQAYNSGVIKRLMVVASRN